MLWSQKKNLIYIYIYMLDNTKAINHFQNHTRNPHINYIVLENCPYCKLEKRLNYGNRVHNLEYSSQNIHDSNDHIIPNIRRHLPPIPNNSNTPFRNERNRILPRIHYMVERHVPRIYPRTLRNRNYHTLYHNYTRQNYINNRVNNRDNYIRQNYINNRANFNNNRQNYINNNRQNYINNRQPINNFEDVKVFTSHKTVNKNSNLSLCTSHNNMCVICQEDITQNSIIRKLKCQHCFHSNCIDKWLETNKKCPLCNYELI